MTGRRSSCNSGAVVPLGWHHLLGATPFFFFFIKQKEKKKKKGPFEVFLVTILSSHGPWNQSIRAIELENLSNNCIIVRDFWNRDPIGKKIFLRLVFGLSLNWKLGQEVRGMSREKFCFRAFNGPWETQSPSLLSHCWILRSRAGPFVKS